jgi:hypothetical protein
MLRLPGVLCVVTNALPIDAGTNVRAAMPAPGSTGKAGEASLSDYDRKLIRDAGLDIHHIPFPLAGLLRAREEHIQQAREAEAQGHPYSALFEQAVIERLDELIAEARSPSGRAAHDLRKMIEGQHSAAATVPEKQLIAAIRALVNADKEGPLDSERQFLIQKAFEALAERKAAEFSKLVQNAKRPHSTVTNKQLANGLAGLLGLAKQARSLGSDIDVDPNDFMTEVLEIKKQRVEKALHHLIDKDHSGGRVTRAQYSQAIAEVLGTERQRQLLGIQGDDGPNPVGQDLIHEALTITYEHDKAALKSLIHGAKHRGNALPTKQFQRAVAQLLGDERQRQLMGYEDDQADPQLNALIEEAAEVFSRRRNPTRVEVKIGTITLTKRASH